ncbi:MAG: DegT/DnrJ/EryC1/StrS family aminotransferase [Planctomycetota bacterium]|nr:DegT/DnrJ/EryC1/StrS family aminotransferase [Planctomycetota bacterium]
MTGLSIIPSGWSVAPDLEAASAFASTVLHDADPVILFGAGPAVTALATAARLAGRRTTQCDAGTRTGEPGDRDRRLADFSADHCFVRSVAERDQLVREGLSAERVQVVGALAAECFDQLVDDNSSGEAGGDVALALTADADGAYTAAARELPLRWRGTPPEPLDELKRLRGAAVIITDDLAYQGLAAEMGVPCVVCAPARARNDLLERGAAFALEHPTALADSVHAARARDVVAPTRADTDASTLIVDALLRSPGDHTDAPDTPLPTEANHTGRTFGAAEANAVHAALQAGALNSTRGTYVHRFEREFAEWLGVKHAVACANGSAAVHCAIAALKLTAGDEVITTPITDMGALTPILYEGAVPVFADVDADTLNVTADTIAAQITKRTRAIIVTHLFGRPCDMPPIMELAAQHGLPVVEDAAQAFGATLGEHAMGTIGAVAAFSLQQGKHITTGEGGIVCTDDDDLARQLFLYVNKAFGYGDKRPDHYFPALNYRMTELQGAVACAQLPKLDEVIARRRMVAADLRARLQDLPGITCPSDPDGGLHAFWKWSFLVDDRVVCGGASELGARMRAQGVACAPRYVQKPAFECQVFTAWREHPVSRLPLTHNPRGDEDGPLFRREDYPGSVRGLEQVVVLPINERYRPEHVARVATAIRSAHEELTSGGC